MTTGWTSRSRREGRLTVRLVVEVDDRERTAVLRHEDGRIGYAALPLLAGNHLVGLLSLQMGAKPAASGAASSPSHRNLESWQEIAAAAADTIAASDKEARMASQA